MTELLTMSVLIALVGGSLLGIIGGATPGLSSAGTVALLIPLTYSMGTLAAILFLLAAYTGAQYGGSITATVFNIPGSPESAVMTVEGYPLTQKGQGMRALQGATFAGLVGGLIGVVVLMLLAPLVAQEALRFGPPELTALGLLGVTVISALGGSSMLKSLLATGFGMLVASIGLDPVSGTSRMTFGLTQLSSGLQLIPVLIGLFAVSQGLLLLTKSLGPVVRTELGTDGVRSKFSMRDLRSTAKYVLTGAFVGMFVGIKPGGGATIASYLSYAAARAMARGEERRMFGNGSLGGLMAPESADKATVGAALIPTLTLGIPASASAAVILGAFRIHNVLPGPTLFSSHHLLVQEVFIGLLAANLVVFGLGQLVFRGALRIRRFTPQVIGLVILTVSLLGAFASGNSPTDVIVAAAFGLIGWVMAIAEIPVAPVILGFILGPIIEINARQTLLISRNSLLIFVDRPIALAIVILALVLFLAPLVARVRRRQKGATANDGAEGDDVSAFAHAVSGAGGRNMTDEDHGAASRIVEREVE